MYFQLSRENPGLCVYQKESAVRMETGYSIRGARYGSRLTVCIPIGARKCDVRCGVEVLPVHLRVPVSRGQCGPASVRRAKIDVCYTTISQTYSSRTYHVLNSYRFPAYVRVILCKNLQYSPHDRRNPFMFVPQHRTDAPKHYACERRNASSSKFMWTNSVAIRFKVIHPGIHFTHDLWITWHS
jgi:hypothetical protein